MLNERHCRYCASQLRYVFVDLGLSPLANRNVVPGEEASEKLYPLVARICENCLLVQVDDSVPPTELFTDYDYFSSFSSSWVEQARIYCEAMRQRFNLGRQSLAIEVASNDGYLLQHFQKMQIRVLGIEPAANVAQVAIRKGIPTENAFFGLGIARQLKENGLRADIMTANNVLAHVPDTRDFIAGFAEILAPQGVATFEFPHVLNLIIGMQFDTIYHEHFFYLSLYTVQKMMASAGLRIFDVESLPSHGGSLRVFVCHDAASYTVEQSVSEICRKEHEYELDRLTGYRDFSAKVEEVKQSFLQFLAACHAEGKIVAAYGAAAKGNTFLNYCGVRFPRIQAVYDRNPAKQGKLTPGSHIPIFDPSAISELEPDFVVILPWNIADEIMSDMSFIADWGGRFVTAIPQTKLL